MRPPVWYLYQCGGGARWSSTAQITETRTCNFSGCNCGTKIEQSGETTEESIAHDWFRRPKITEWQKKHRKCVVVSASRDRNMAFFAGVDDAREFARTRKPYEHAKVYIEDTPEI